MRTSKSLSPSLFVRGVDRFRLLSKGWGVKVLSLMVVVMVGVNGLRAQTTIFRFDFESGNSPSTDNAVGTPAFSKIGTFSSSGTTSCNGSGGIIYAAWDAGDAYRW